MMDVASVKNQCHGCPKHKDWGCDFILIFYLEHQGCYLTKLQLAIIMLGVTLSCDLSQHMTRIIQTTFLLSYNQALQAHSGLWLGNALLWCCSLGSSKGLLFISHFDAFTRMTELAIQKEGYRQKRITSRETEELSFDWGANNWKMFPEWPGQGKWMWQMEGRLK